MIAGLGLLALLLLPKAITAQVYEGEHFDASYGVVRRIEDPRASEGIAVLCERGVHPPNFMFASGYYETDPGRYRATWRLLVPDNTSAEVLLRLDCIQPGEEPGMPGQRELRGTDFAAAGEWEEFSFEFERAELGRVQYRGYWTGAGHLALDYLRIERIGDLSEDELYERAMREYPVEVPADLDSLWRAGRNGRPDVLELRGAEWEELWRVPEAMATLPGVRFESRGWEKIWHHTTDWGHYLPATYEEMFAYDVVVMTCGDGRRLQAIGRRMLQEFVRRGGGLVVLGGYMSFGKGRLQGSWLEEILPVTVGSPWDLVPAENSQIVSRGRFPAFRLPDGWSGRGLWLHEVSPRPEAEVVWTCGERPALVLGKYGEGRVVAVPLTPLGHPEGDLVLLHETPAWPAMLGRIIHWAAEPAW